MATTTAAEMRAKRDEGIEIVLPEYGDVVRIRPIDAAFFLQSGRVPDFLAPYVRKHIMVGVTSEDTKALYSPEKTEEFLSFVADLVKWTLVSPKVVDAPHEDADEISLDVISLPDRLFIWTLFGTSAQALRKFRGQQSKPVALVDAQQNTRPTAERRAEHPGVVEPTARDA